MNKLIKYTVIIAAVLGIAYVVKGVVIDKSDQSEDMISWAYEGPGAPEHWGTLSNKYIDCKVSGMQSPINIVEAEEADLPPLALNYKAVPLRIVDTGYSILVDYDAGEMQVGDEVFKVVQFHFHTPGEHAINGQGGPLEMHIIHHKEDGSLGVLGIIMHEGKHNDEMQKIVSHLPHKLQEGLEYKKVKIDAKKLLPASKRYYSFTGSLTIPPCAEGVKWHLLHDPVEISKEQIDAISNFYTNSRPLQDVNGRSIQLSK